MSRFTRRHPGPSIANAPSSEPLVSGGTSFPDVAPDIHGAVAAAQAAAQEESGGPGAEQRREPPGRETSEEVAAVAADLMDHPEPKVRKVAASALAQKTKAPKKATAKK